MTKPSLPDLFTREVARAYDDVNSRLAPIAENMHFLIRLLLKDLPARSHVLCVGIGTGTEVLSLAKAFPDWTFVGVDPSMSMLEVCGERLRNAAVSDRCKLVHGYVHDLPRDEHFDVVLSILVAHFVRREERLGFYQNMASRLKREGCLVNTELSYDLNSAEFLSMLKNWEQVQTLMGATPESLARLPQQLREVLTVFSNAETERCLRQSGIQEPVRFFQAFMITGWYGKKTGSRVP